MGHIHKIIRTFMHNPMPEDVQDRFAVWLLSENDPEEKAAALEQEWEAMSRQVKQDSVSSVVRWARLKRLHREIGYKENMPLRKRGLFVSWGMMAACLACFLLFSSAALMMWKAVRPVQDDSLTCYVTSPSGKGEFTLPDGTRVWLNSDGRIEFRGDLSGDVREVRLYGEAFFDVMPSDRFFVVDMGDIDVRVLGTEFNARNTDVYGDYQVTLTEGKVQVESERFAPVTLAPGQQFSAPKDLKTAYVRNVRPGDFSSWTESCIAFENRTLGDIITNLEHWYNVDIDIAEGVDRDIRMSLTLKHETLSKTMELICTLAGTRCVYWDAKRILVTSK